MEIFRCAQVPLTSGEETHQVSATVIMSAQGFRGSPYLPAECKVAFPIVTNNQYEKQFHTKPWVLNRRERENEIKQRKSAGLKDEQDRFTWKMNKIQVLHISESLLFYLVLPAELLWPENLKSYIILVMTRNADAWHFLYISDDHRISLQLKETQDVQIIST